MSKAKIEIMCRTGNLAMWKRLLPILLYAGLVSVTGCSGIAKELTRHPNSEFYCMQYNIRYEQITNSTIEKMEPAGSVCEGDVEVYYKRGLEAQADCIAAKTNILLNDVEERTGLQIPYKVKVYLIRMERIPENVDACFKISPSNELYLPLFVEAGNESCESIISQNIFYPDYIVHELAETSLAGFQKCRRHVLGDYQLALFGRFIQVDISNYTRWFREGFASYAGYLAYETIRPQINSKSAYAKCKTFWSPFTSLSKVRKKLFSWKNTSAKALDGDYYNASVGLFLLVRNLFGEQAVREIILKINMQDDLNGEDLIKLTNKVLGTDIEELAEHFSFPRTGLETEGLTAADVMNRDLSFTEGLGVIAVEPNSPADKAGIKEYDVILKVDDKPVIISLDFELAILDALDRKAVKLTVWKKENRKIAELQLPID